MLQLPDRFPAYNRPNRSASQLPTVERRIARRGLKHVDLDRPFQIRIDQRDVGHCANRQSSRFEL